MAQAVVSLTASPPTSRFTTGTYGMYNRILFQLVFLLTVLKLAPYEADDDDTSAFVSSLTITLTCLCGFAMMLGADEYSGNAIGSLLVVIGSMNVAFELFVMVRGECLARKANKDVRPQGPTNKVVPVSAKLTTEDRARTAWRADT